ncbi:IS3 family transposase [Kitasatospora sp. NPDC048298]|uniref:IS3 family transposase n=1 Tax=Kitasatospora sp. NPDC048298 TaxID=3364049 RepID=UPI0037100DE8
MPGLRRATTRTGVNVQASTSVLLLCRVMGVSRSTYYAWVASRPAVAERERIDDELADRIRKIHAASRGAYGVPRVHAALRRQGHGINRKKVERIMRARDIRGVTRRRRRHLTKQDSKAAPAPDLVGRDFTAERPGTKLVGDITYLPTIEGWWYLATVIDPATREVIGYAMADHHRAELVTDALKMAAGRSDLRPGCIMHTDRGSEYTSTEFRRETRKSRLRLRLRPADRVRPMRPGTRRPRRRRLRLAEEGGPGGSQQIGGRGPKPLGGSQPRREVEGFHRQNGDGDLDSVRIGRIRRVELRRCAQPDFGDQVLAGVPEILDRRQLVPVHEFVEIEKRDLHAKVVQGGDAVDHARHHRLHAARIDLGDQVDVDAGEQIGPDRLVRHGQPQIVPDVVRHGPAEVAADAPDREERLLQHDVADPDVRDPVDAGECDLMGRVDQGENPAAVVRRGQGALETVGIAQCEQCGVGERTHDRDMSRRSLACRTDIQARAPLEQIRNRLWVIHMQTGVAGRSVDSFPSVKYGKFAIYVNEASLLRHPASAPVAP